MSKIEKKFENENKNWNKLSKYTLSELKEIMVTPLIKEGFSFENRFINEKINDKNFNTSI